MKQPAWYEARVIKGQQLGRTIGFPTLNLEPVKILTGYATGVYGARLIIRGKEYKGALYYGPRYVVQETRDVLEIHVFDFDQEIYGSTVLFQPTVFTRPPIDISDITALKKQLQQDCRYIKETFQENPHL